MGIALELVTISVVFLAYAVCRVGGDAGGWSDAYYEQAHRDKQPHDN